jgi:hypothetical protein
MYSVEEIHDKLKQQQRRVRCTADALLPVIQAVLETKEEHGDERAMELYDAFKLGDHSFGELSRDHESFEDLAFPQYSSIKQQWTLQDIRNGGGQQLVRRGNGTDIDKPPLRFCDAVNEVKIALEILRECSVGELEQHLSGTFYLPPGIMRCIFRKTWRTVQSTRAITNTTAGQSLPPVNVRPIVSSSRLFGNSFVLILTHFLFPFVSTKACPWGMV